MAQILITNYTGTVNADIVVCEAVSPAPYTMGTCYTLGEQITPNTQLPQFFVLPNSFDYQSYCFVYLSASTTLQSVPQLIACGDVPPNTWGFEKCSPPLNKNIYVFYDASGGFPDGVNIEGVGSASLSGASQIIRDWYYDLVNISGYTGNLYEIPMTNKRYLSWASYPYLTSTTGGTLSDSTEVRIEGGIIANPNLASMAPISPAGNTALVNQSAIVKNIATACDLSTGFALPIGPGYSLGVPYSHTAYNSNTNGINQSGKTAVADTNYIAIILTNDASGGPGPYDCSPYSATSGGTYYKYQPYFKTELSPGQNFSAITNTFGTINTAPTVVIPVTCGNYPGYGGSYSGSSLQRDYESWLKVWEDVNVNLNGFAQVYMMPIPTKETTGSGLQDIFYGTVYQAIELIEGEVPQAPSYFQSNYCDGVFDYSNATWPFPNAELNANSGYSFNQVQYFDFSPLSYYNRFTTFTATTAYQSLNPLNQIGPGLKNFGWAIDVTMTGFSQSNINGSLNAFIQLISDGEMVYTPNEPISLNEGQVVTLEDFEGCWTYTGFRLDGQPSYNTLSPINFYSTCEECYQNINETVIRFALNGNPSIFKAGYVSTAETQNYPSQIKIFGAPNESVDITIDWPFPIGTAIPGVGTFELYYNGSWTPFTLGTYTGFTVTLDNDGQGTIDYKIIGGTIGVEFIKFDITASTSTLADTLYLQYLQTNSPTSLVPNTFTLLNLVKLDENIENDYICVVGTSAITASTSATACSDYAVEEYYFLQLPGFTQDQQWPDPSVLLMARIYDKDLNLVNATNWIALSNAYYTVYGQEQLKIVIQCNGDGSITDVGLC